MSDEVSDVRSAKEPFDRLTVLCRTMTDALEEALAVEDEENRGKPELSKIKTIVFLEDDQKAGIQIFGYDSSTEAMAALFVHMKAIFQASGRDLEFVAVPDFVDGAEG